MTQTPPLPPPKASSLPAALFPELQAVCARLYGSRGPTAAMSQPQTMQTAANSGAASQFNSALMPHGIYPGDLAISVDFLAKDRLEKQFAPYKPLADAFSYIHAAVRTNYLRSDANFKQELIPAVHAYLGLMLCAQGTKRVFEQRGAFLIESAIKAVMDPDAMKPTVDSLKEHLEERWPSLVKDADALGLVAENLESLCTKNGYRFQEDGNLDLRAIDLFLKDVLPLIAEDQPDTAEIIDREESAYPARRIALATSTPTIPTISTYTDFVAVPRKQVEDALQVIAGHPQALADARAAGRKERDSDVEEARRIGAQAAQKSLADKAAEERRKVNSALRNYEKAEAFYIAPDLWISAGTARAKDQLIGRMSLLLSFYLKDLFGNREIEAVERATTTYANLLFPHLARALNDLKPPLSRAMLARVEWDTIYNHFMQVVTVADVIHRLGDTVLVAVPQDSQAEMVERIINEGLNDLYALLYCEEVINDGNNEETLDTMMPRNALQLLRELAREFDGYKNKSKLLKALRADRTRGAAVQALTEQAISEGNIHCITLLAGNEYPVEAPYIAWDKEYSMGHLTANQVAFLAQFGNAAAITHLQNSVDTGYHHGLLDPSKPFSPPHPRYVRALYVLAMNPTHEISGPALAKLTRVPTPSLSHWVGEVGSFEAISAMLQIASLKAAILKCPDISRDFLRALTQDLISVTSDDLRAIAQDASLSVVEKQMLGILYKLFRNNAIPDDANKEPDSAMTQAHTMTREASLMTVTFPAMRVRTGVAPSAAHEGQKKTG